MKKCKWCKKTLTQKKHIGNREYCSVKCRDKSFYHKNSDRIKKQKADNMRKYRAADPDKFNKQNRAAKARIRMSILDMYGRKCVLCNFDNPKALTLDHINGNGKMERTLFGERGVYKRALEKYRPEEYRILCMNCQFITRG